MTFDLSRAMRAAREMTRARDLTGATQAIRNALAQAGHGRTAPGVDAVSRPSGANPPSRALNGVARPYSMPLGDVVKILRQATKQARQGGGSKAPLVSASTPDGAQFIAATYSGPSGSRDYRLYVPRAFRPGMPLIVMLHGCTQDAMDFAAGTQMNGIAEERAFLVAYPIQPRSKNPSSCWNWFRPEDQRRGTGEPAVIAGLTADIVAQYGANPQRVFVAGLSAGGAMAAVMGATYPDRYAGIGVHSGLAHGAASDVMSALAVMRSGTKSAQRSRASGRVPRTIVFHGDGDQTVHPENAQNVVDGAAFNEELRPDTTQGRASGRGFVRRVYRDANGASRIEHWTLRGGGHAWSGGSLQGTYTDETGPNASQEMVRFFLETD